MSEVINIALVDDEILLVEGMALILSNVDDINVVKTANNGKDFLIALEELDSSMFPSIAIVDIQMKPMNGFDLTEILKDKYPDLKVIIFSSHYKTNVLGHMIKLGVSAFIPKNSNKESLITAIKSVHQTGVYFTSTDQEMLEQYKKHPSKKPFIRLDEELTEREIEVLKLICKELTNQEIGNQLYLSKRTIDSHRKRILDKVGAKNTAGLVVFAIANNYHPIPKF